MTERPPNSPQPCSFLDFRPLPFLRNPHLQTLLGHVLQGAPFTFPTRGRELLLADGDRLVLHDSAPPGWQEGRRIAVLIHGLGGSHRSFHLQRMAGLLLRRGLRVVRLDLRGCGHGIGLARRAYHGGSSDDVRAALAEVRRWASTSPLVLIGFSLGGNISLKLAGEASESPVPGLERVVAVAPPVDLERCAALLVQPHNRFYERRFVRDLVGQLRQRQRLMPDLPRLRFPAQLTLRQFDELHTAPSWGFADALDYYRRVSSRPLLARIAVPTLILTARDDPFVAVEGFQGLTLPANVHLHIVDHGGHLGFLGWDGAGGIRWAEPRVARWVTGGDALPPPPG